MVRLFRILRLVTRIVCISILCLTAIAAWQNRPSTGSPGEDDNTMAPRRQSNDGFPQAFIEKCSGGPASLSILGFQILDPFLGMISVLAVPQTLGPVALACSVPLLLTLFFGRFFCGYVCPIGWLAVVHHRLRHKWNSTNSDSRASLSYTPGVIVLSIAGLIAILGLPSATALFLVHLQIQQAAFSPTSVNSLLAASGVILAFIVIDLFIAPGLWCRALCPSGTVYRLVGTFRRFRIAKATTSPCPSSCNRCSERCWLHLQPKDGTPGSTCDMCLTCAAVCPQKKLTIRPVRKWRNRNGTKSAFFAIISILCIAVSLTSGKPANATQPPALDDNPPWSTNINRLDWEGWTRNGKRPTGLSISFLERTNGSHIYMFSASRGGEDAGSYDQGAVRFTLSSNGESATLFLEEPNAPRSTTSRSVYSGRAWVEVDACSTLRADFASDGDSIEVAFPKNCRETPKQNFLLGVLGWSALIVTLIGIGFLVPIRKKRP